MTNKQILQKAIQKAIDGGWTGCHITHSTLEKWVVTDTPKLCIYWTTGGNAYFHPYEFIFNHDFAKALWGDEGFTTTGLKCGKYDGVQRFWQYHLQQMVISEDPIKYLGENL